MESWSCGEVWGVEMRLTFDSGSDVVTPSSISKDTSGMLKSDGGGLKALEIKEKFTTLILNNITHGSRMTVTGNLNCTCLCSSFEMTRVHPCESLQYFLVFYLPQHSIVGFDCAGGKYRENSWLQRLKAKNGNHVANWMALPCAK